MKPISKPISYGYCKSVQLFEDHLECSKMYVLVISDRGVCGDLCNMAEYRYDDYMKAVRHMHEIVMNFFYCDLCQQ